MIQFSDKRGTRRCTACKGIVFEEDVVEPMHYIECVKCREVDCIEWKNKRWEGEKERYEANPRDY